MCVLVAASHVPGMVVGSEHRLCPAASAPATEGFITGEFSSRLGMTCVARSMIPKDLHGAVKSRTLEPKCVG